MGPWWGKLCKNVHDIDVCDVSLYYIHYFTTCFIGNKLHVLSICQPKIEGGTDVPYKIRYQHSTGRCIEQSLRGHLLWRRGYARLCQPTTVLQSTPRCHA